MTIFDIARYQVPRRSFFLSLAIFGLIIGLAGCPMEPAAEREPAAPAAEVPQITAAASIAPLTIGTTIPAPGIVIATKSGGGDIASCEVATGSPDQLPTGLNLGADANGNCVITGTPAGTMSRTYNVKIVARNSRGISNAIDLVLNVNAFNVGITANKDSTPLTQPIHARLGDSITITLTVPNTGTYTYAWKQKIGEAEATTLSGETSATLTPTLPTPTAGSTSSRITYSATITRNDNVTAIATLSLTVHSAPVAIITSPTTGSSVEENVVISLDGSASTGDGLRYLWTQTGTPGAAIVDNNAAITTATLPATDSNTDINFILTVTNPAGGVSSATAAITVTPAAIGTIAFSLADGNFTSAQTLQITYNAVGGETPDSILYTFTIDGTVPADPSLPASSPSTYTSGIPILSNDGTQYDIRAIARRGSSTSVEITGDFSRFTDSDGDAVFDYLDIDDDNDGLIEISGNTMAEQLTMLHNMRYNLAGTSYKTSAAAAGNTTGAPTTATADCSTGTDGDGDANTALTFLCGYELTGNLTFDTGSNGTWTNTGTAAAPVYTLDSVDNASPYFEVTTDEGVTTGGWIPIGDCGQANDACETDGSKADRPFSAIFDGNGFTITGLAIQRDNYTLGFFGYAQNATIRNIGLLQNLSNYSGTALGGRIGGLLGQQSAGKIASSYSTGPIDGGNGSAQRIGGLVGINRGGIIIDSHSSGSVLGSQNTGGLVGELEVGGSIIASYATGDVTNGDFDLHNAGGLVAYQQDSSIIASYATGDVHGGALQGDYVGGLTGYLVSGTIIASYATGSVDGGEGIKDRAGGLVGNFQVTSSNIIEIVASYATGNSVAGNSDSTERAGALAGSGKNNIFASFGFGTASATDTDSGTAGTTIDNTIHTTWTSGSTVADLTLDIVNNPNNRTDDAGTPADTTDDIPNPDDNKWNSATDLTSGAWNFDMKATANGGGPALNYADYDGTGNTYYCTGETKPTTGTPIEIPNCGTIIPGQRN